MIKMQNISLLRGPQRVLNGASLTVQSGRRLGLIGANGCGKSSLFELLMGQLQLDDGDLTMPPRWRLSHMAQEVAAQARSALDYVLDGDKDLRRVQAAIAAAEQANDDTALAALYSELEQVDGYAADYKAEQLLQGLGFKQGQLREPVQAFSGGWRIRLNLAQALMCPSDCLLLDEPTNHLDLDATLWLEQWLKSYPGTLMLISHDRDFLDNVVDEIAHIAGGQINHYRGNYSAFERQKAERAAQQQAGYEKQQQRVKEIHNFVSRFRAKATKAKQAQSRLKELERMEMLAPAHVDSPFHFVFYEADKISAPLINLDHANLGYGSESVVLERVNMSLQPGARIGLLGPNGAGKSTLVKSLVGDLPVLDGARVCGENLAVGYFAQHQLEALDLAASALTHIQRLSPAVSEQSIRDYLGGFDFHGAKALEPIAPFSGGEKARLALALIVWARPNLLLLDEPTNHLDLEMRHALEVALQGFTGALVVISHDRHLLRNTVDDFHLVVGGRVEPFKGTLDDYHAWLRDHQAGGAMGEGAGLAAGSDRKAQRQLAAAQRASLAPQKKRLKKLESGMEHEQARLTEVESALSVPDLYEAANRAELQQRLQQQGQHRKVLAELEAEWLEISELLEGGEQG